MNVVTLTPAPASLVAALTDQLVTSIMAPAVEALSPISVRRIRAAVERYITAGRLDVARNFVAAEIEVASVAAEASRHMHDSDCRLCPDLWQHCDDLEALEAREDALHQQIARWGGF